MSSLGRTVSQIKKSGRTKSKIFVEEKFPIGIKTPLEPGYRDNESLFKMNFEPIEQIKDNLKNLILTQKGERLGFPDFGTNLLQIYSDTSLEENEIVDIVVKEISDAVLKYMPSLFLQNFYSQKIDDDQTGANVAGSEFSNNLNTVSIESGNIYKTNKVSSSKETVYKLVIEFNMPSLSNENQKILLYIKSAR
jgi:phage baseplate assembly protein W